MEINSQSQSLPTSGYISNRIRNFYNRSKYWKLLQKTNKAVYQPSDQPVKELYLLEKPQGNKTYRKSGRSSAGTTLETLEMEIQYEKIINRKLE